MSEEQLKYEVARDDEDMYTKLDEYLNKIMAYIKGTEERHAAVVFLAMAVDEQGTPISVKAEMGGDDAMVRYLLAGAFEKFERAHELARKDAQHGE